MLKWLEYSYSVFYVLISVWIYNILYVAQINNLLYNLHSSMYLVSLKYS